MNSISIILIAWKDFESVSKVLNHLASFKQLEIKIYLVQNESAIDNFENFTASNIIKLFAKKNIGFSGANNLAFNEILKTESQYTLLLNADAHIEEKEIIKLLNCIKINENCFSIGPIIEEHFKNEKSTFIGGNNIAKNINTRILQKNSSNAESEIVKVFYNIGAIILFKNKLLKSVGLFDEDYFFSAEVADLCYRAKKLNYCSLTCTKAIGYHYTEDSKNRASLYKYYSLRNRCLFIKKHNLGFKLLLNWYYFILKEMLHGFLTLNALKIKTMAITIFDITLNYKGNRNHLFLDE